MSRIALKDAIKIIFYVNLLISAGPVRLRAETKQPQNLDVLKKECFAENNFGSCLTLAKALEKQKSDPDLQRALMKLCDARDGQSCLTLGQSAERANALLDAASWFRKACDTGFQSGEGCLAMAKLAGKQQNKKNAEHWLKKACEHGNKTSCDVKK